MAYAEQKHAFLSVEDCVKSAGGGGVENRCEQRDWRGGEREREIEELQDKQQRRMCF